MQDRFKFRIFCKSENKMMLFNNPTLIDGDILEGGILFKNYDHKIKNVHEVKSSDLVLMQCTGLKDKNGKLIYEGDILKNDYGDLYPINWNKKGFWETTSFAMAGFFNALDRYEVIGNIYETPELLKDGE